MFRNKHFLSLSGQVISGLLGFISFGIIARISDKVSFGNWIVFITAYTFFEMLRNGMIQTSLVKFLAGSAPENAIKINGAGWFISLVFSFIYILTGLILISFNINDTGWLLFIRYGAISLLFSLPYNYTIWLLQVDFQFNKILILRLLNQGSFVILLLLQIILRHSSLKIILGSFIIANLIPGLISFFLGWSRFTDLFHTSKETILTLFHYGKYSMGTSVGSNLLKSSDTFIIQALMGPYFVALYTAPQKMLEIIEIPLRSFAATAIPLMAGYANKNDKPQVSMVFEKYTGGISLMIIPFLLACILFASLIMRILGGNAFAGTGSTLQIFMVYALLMPLDRFLGISLDILNKPALNFIKVMFMLGVNIAGDLIAIRYFHSINIVALSSLLTFISGIIIGRLFLKKYLNFTTIGIFRRGIDLVKEYFGKMKNLFQALGLEA